MKRGKSRIIVGILLIFFQILSCIGNAKSGYQIHLSFENFNVFLYDLLVLVGYFFVGIIGAVVLFSGVIAYFKKSQPNDKVQYDHSANDLDVSNPKIESDTDESSFATLPSDNNHVERNTNLFQKEKTKKDVCNKRKTLYVILSIALLAAIIIPVFFFVMEGTHKDKDYVYEWLVEEGNLVNNSRLEYRQTKDGVQYALCYSKDSVDSLNMSVNCSFTSSEGYLINASIHLYTGNKGKIYISAKDDSGLNRYYEYKFEIENFTKNTPIEYTDNDGDTVDISGYSYFADGCFYIDYDSMPQEKRGKIKTLDNLNAVCEELAHPTLCLLLDWLKQEFCPLANMKMSDFGYNKY